MSLEVKIEALTAAIQILIAQNEQFLAAANAPRTPLVPDLDADGVAETPPEKPKAKAAKAKKAKAEPAEETSPPAPTVEEVQALCLEIVRADRSKRDAIKDAIASFDGAKTVAKVPAEELVSLVEKLEALR